MTALNERLAKGEVFIIDGAIGSELERRGVPMDEDAWCGLSNLTHGDSVRKLHEDYIRAGANIITTNTFGTAPHVLEATVLKEYVDEININAAIYAREARDRVAAKHDVWIAGSMSPMLAKNAILPAPEALKASYERQAKLMADAGVDLIICEMMSLTETALPIVKAAKTTGLPVWIGFSAEIDKDGKVQPWGSEHMGLTGNFTKTLDDIIPLGADVIGVMHTTIPDMPSVLDLLLERWNGTTFVYAESGHFEPPCWVYDESLTPAAYAEICRQWLNHGVQILGGCCGIGPEHIYALSKYLPKFLPRN